MKVLTIIPHDCFRDEELTAAKDIIEEAGHEFSVGSSHHTEAKGHYGLLVKPDITLRFVETDDYDCLIFIGGRGVEEYLTDSTVMEIIRNFYSDGKLICAIGMAVEILVYAGILAGRRVTCDNLTILKVQNGGAYYTGGLVEEDGNLITGSGIEAKDEFAKTIVSALEYENKKRGAYARIT